MSETITIRKVILELHAGSRGLADETERNLREAVHSIVAPAMEAYFSRMHEQGIVLRTDRLVLDLGEIRPAPDMEDIREKIMKCLDRNNGVKFEGPVYHARQEVSAHDAVMHFLLTGVLPWTTSRADGMPLASLLGLLCEKDAGSIRKIIAHVCTNSASFPRLVLHVPDETLRQMSALFLPPETRRILWDELEVIWKELATFSSARRERLAFWQIVLDLLAGAHGAHNLVHAFMARWAALHRGDASVLLKKIQAAAGERSTTRSLLSQLLSWRSGAREELYYLQMALHHTLSVIEREATRNMMAGSRYRVDLQLRMLETIAHYMVFLPHHLRVNFRAVIRLCLEPAHFRSSVNDALSVMQVFLEKLQHVSESYTFNNDAVINMIRELLRKKDHADSFRQFLYLLEKMDQVIVALPPSALSRELSLHVERVKQKLGIYLDAAGDTDHASLLRRLAKQLASGSDEVAVMDTGFRLNTLLKVLLPAIFPAHRQEALQKLLQEIEQGLARTDEYGGRNALQQCIRAVIAHDDNDAVTEEEVPDVAVPECYESYIVNAGLVLIAPFIRMLFEETTLAEGNAFRNDEARAQAVMVLQYIATGEEQCDEYHLPLNKVLCGLNITDAVDLSQPLDMTLKEEADNMLESLIQQAPAFKNISVAGFRNAFIKREGALNVQNNPLLLKVSRESFDIVLEKVSWQYHVVRLPWMDKPLMIEW